mmetsp:Transcript_64471/g.165889  ORF Transcript_64471/g.165889 Transcript_64471/m.165889 type:complete len:414 (-) Transcript_64471:318-1559(-)
MLALSAGVLEDQVQSVRHEPGDLRNLLLRHVPLEELLADFPQLLVRCLPRQLGRNTGLRLVLVFVADHNSHGVRREAIRRQFDCVQDLRSQHKLRWPACDGRADTVHGHVIRQAEVPRFNRERTRVLLVVPRHQVEGLLNDTATFCEVLHRNTHGPTQKVVTRHSVLVIDEEAGPLLAVEDQEVVDIAMLPFRRACLLHHLGFPTVLPKIDLHVRVRGPMACDRDVRSAQVLSRLQKHPQHPERLRELQVSLAHLVVGEQVHDHARGDRHHVIDLLHEHAEEHILDDLPIRNVGNTSEVEVNRRRINKVDLHATEEGRLLHFGSQHGRQLPAEDKLLDAHRDTHGLDLDVQQAMDVHVDLNDNRLVITLQDFDVAEFGRRLADGHHWELHCALQHFWQGLVDLWHDLLLHVCP